MSDELIKGLPLFINSDSNILILGSFPSVKSRLQEFYYGNPLNRFWKVLAYSFDEEEPKTIDEKKLFLTKHHIALFDIVKECHINGSLDSNIKDYVVNDIAGIVSNYPIKKIICNGNKSKDIYLKYFKDLPIETHFLPSTSPANTTKFDIEAWKKNLNL